LTPEVLAGSLTGRKRERTQRRVTGQGTETDGDIWSSVRELSGWVLRDKRVRG